MVSSPRALAHRDAQRPAGGLVRRPARRGRLDAVGDGVADDLPERIDEPVEDAAVDGFFAARDHDLDDLAEPRRLAARGGREALEVRGRRGRAQRLHRRAEHLSLA
jgi:hypothetical protein